MTEPTRDVADLVTALLRELPAADLAALAEGRARLAVVPVDATPPAPPTDRPATGRPRKTPAATARPTGAPADLTAATARPTGAPGGRGVGASRPAAQAGRRAAPAPDPAVARAALATMSRRDDGTAYLSGWTSRDLRVLAASLELRGVAGLRKADLVDRIVDRTIGFRLASAAVRRL
ncbi:hypothetical protein KBX06_17125 [Micromonospora sp. C31]|uniref:Rho termination factor N-terminal domain-containing protein n=1 Tax=Micromonospora sp. C31 TaxID=2824876 RepID=UPI001B3758DE|nr:Rho termination factor N-terminal domain-containing protein [Micromonospora sp. C31]MBQ1074875.1 hypothetical protein [Micromonospora sp. C31]